MNNMAASLSFKQIRAIQLKAEGKTDREISKQLEISYQTVSTWNKEKVFHDTLNIVKKEALKSVTTRIQYGSQAAIEALIDLAMNSKNSETRRKAANDILRLAGFEPDNHSTYAWNID